MFNNNKKIVITATLAFLLLGPPVKSCGFIWGLGYPTEAGSCLILTQLYYGKHDAP